jgi:hypothetical protein
MVVADRESMNKGVAGIRRCACPPIWSGQKGPDEIDIDMLD